MEAKGLVNDMKRQANELHFEGWNTLEAQYLSAFKLFDGIKMQCTVVVLWMHELLLEQLAVQTA